MEGVLTMVTINYGNRKPRSYNKAPRTSRRYAQKRPGTIKKMVENRKGKYPQKPVQSPTTYIPDVKEDTMKFIINAGAQYHILEIDYINTQGPRKGLYSQKWVEPYSFRDMAHVGTVLYAWDLTPPPGEPEEIKSFALSHIAFIREARNADGSFAIFTPRFPVEFISGGYQTPPLTNEMQYQQQQQQYTQPIQTNVQSYGQQSQTPAPRFTPYSNMPQQPVATPINNEGEQNK